MGNAISMLFGSARNPIAETVQVFRENAEHGAMREAALSEAALAQFAAEFAHPRKAIFDQVIDGLNRVPRPAMALGTIGLFATAMINPAWFASRMEGVALVPEPLWWLMGAIVGFYFGARHQAKGQEFQRSIAATLARAGHLRDALVANRARPVEPIDTLAAQSPSVTPMIAPRTVDGAKRFPHNAALAEWSDARA